MSSSKRNSRATRVATAALASLMAVSGVAAQDAEDDDKEIEMMVVVGSAIRTPTAESDTTSQPVQYLTRERFDLTPADSIADFLQELPVATGFGRTSINDEYNGGRASINLRGLGQQYTLVLVDGRRLGGENVPDIGAIPPGAIEGIEVLKTGASAIYGSDAVSGVVNIRLRKNYEGIEFHSSYGGATLGGGRTFRVGSVFGLQEGPFSFTGSFEYQDDNGFQKFQRELTRSRDHMPFGGLDRRSGTMTEPHQVFLATGERLVMDTSRFGPGSVPTSPADFVPRTPFFAMSGQEQSKQPPQERWSGHWASTYEFMDGEISFYTRGYIDNRQRNFIIHPPMTFVNVSADNPNNPFGVPAGVFYLFGPTVDVQGVDFGETPFDDLMRIDSNTLNLQGTAGLEGTIGERFTWDLGYTYFRERANIFQRNDIALSRAQEAVDSGLFNPFCIFCNGQDVIDAVSVDTLTQRINKVQTIDFTVSGDLFDWSGGTVQFAAGYQHREVDFALRPDQAAQTYSFWWNGSAFDPESGSRNVDAGFVELRVPLYDNPDEGFFTGAEINGAVRHENYSDFGSSTVWQTFGKLTFLDEQVIFRGSFAKTFRAPSVDALTTPEVTAFQGGLAFFDPVIDGIVSELNITSGGNPDLEPEIGNTFNFGLIVRPESVPNLFFSIDYWRTDISDIIRTPSIQGLFFGTETGGSLNRNTQSGIPDVDVRLDNGGKLEAAGIDFSATYHYEVGRNDLSFFANGTRLTTFEESANAETIVHLGEFSQSFNAIPKWKVVTGVTLDRGPLDAAITFNYTGGVRDAVADIERKTDSYETIDIQVGYDLGESFGNGVLSDTRIYVGADNVLGHKPIFIAEFSDAALETSPNTLLGRFIYAGIRKKF